VVLCLLLSTSTSVKTNLSLSNEDICKQCPVSSHISSLSAIENTMKWSLWANNSVSALGCACELIRRGKASFYTYTVVRGILSGENPLLKVSDLSFYDPPKSVKASSTLNRWELLGPFPVSKLELDGDPTFDLTTNSDRSNKDLGLRILGMPSNSKAYSELVRGGEVTWTEAKSVKASPGDISVSFPVSWNDLVSGLSSLAVYEFQAWARGSFAVAQSGEYLLHCLGPHTVYLHQDGYTRVLVGDVYRSQLMVARVSLSESPFGIVLPIRAMGQTSFSCSLKRVASVFDVLSVSSVPQSLLADAKLPRGKLLTPIFAVKARNNANTTISLKLAIDNPRCQIISHLSPVHRDVVTVASGQTISIPVELQCPSDMTFPCCPAASLTLSISDPALSSLYTVTSSISFECRKRTQSLLLSFIDHDGSVAQAAVLFPLLPLREQMNAWNQSYSGLISLHGTGITATSQADAYKVMPAKQNEYLFGVADLWVICPTRHGAHNWEGVGMLTAIYSIRAVRSVFDKWSQIIRSPTISDELAIAMGHSMGASRFIYLFIYNQNRYLFQ
jgi:hypothetical protein